MAREELLLLIKAETQKAVQEMQKMNNSINKTQAGIKGTIEGFKNFAMKALVVVAAIKGLINVFKGTTEAYKKQLEAEVKLESALKATGYAVGITAEEMKAMAAGMQQTTVFGNELVINAQAIMTTFTKIGKDVFPEAIARAADMSTMFGQDLQQSVIQLGTALNDPIAGIGRLKRIGISFSEEQKKQIKSFMDMNDIASAQKVILDELGVEFGGVAEEMGKTPIGIFKRFDNTMSDLNETIGMYISNAAVPLAESFTKMAEGVNAFLKSREGMAQIQAILSAVAGVGSILSTIFGKIFSMFKDFTENIASKVSEEFSEIVGEGNESNVIFTILGGIVQVVSAHFAIFGKIIEFAINHLSNLIQAAMKTGDVLVKLVQALIDPFNQEKWDALGTAGQEALDQWVKTGGEFVTGIGEIISTVMDEFGKFVEGTTQNAEELKKNTEASIDAVNKLMEALKSNNKALLDDLNNVPPALQGTTDEIENILAEWENIHLTDVEKEIKKLDEMKANFEKAGIDRIEIEEWYQGEIDAIRQEQHDKEKERMMDLVQTSLDFTNQMVTGMADIFSMYFNNKNIELDNNYKKEKEAIEKNVKDEDEKNKALAKLEADYDKKRGQIKTRQARQEKAWGIVQSIIDTGAAVMKTFAQLGFPWGIPAAVAVGALGAAKTAMIASQPIPKFEQGGAFTVPPGFEDDSFLMRAKSGEEVNIRRPDQAGQPIQIKIYLGEDIIWDKAYQASINGNLLIDTRALTGG